MLHDASLCCLLCASLCVNSWPPCSPLQGSLCCVLGPSWGPECATLLGELSWQTHKLLTAPRIKAQQSVWKMASIFAGSTHKAIMLEVEIGLTSWYNLSTCNSWHGWLNHLRLNRQYCEQMVNNLRKVKLWAGLRLNFVSYLSYCHRCRLAALNHSRLYSIYKMNFKSFKSKWDKAEFLDLD